MIWNSNCKEIRDDEVDCSALKQKSNITSCYKPERQSNWIFSCLKPGLGCFWHLSRLQPLNSALEDIYIHSS